MASTAPGGDVARPQPDHGPLSREAAVRRVTSNTAVVHRADRVVSKSTTWGRYVQERARAGIGDDVALGQPSPTTVWVVAVEGDVHPPRAPVADAYSWAMFVIDERTGSTISTVASNGRLPPYFDAIPDTTSP